MTRLMHVLGGSLLALLISLSPNRALAVDKLPATIKLTVPADAVVEINGVKMKQSGSLREFFTPDLETGKKFTYEMKVTFSQGGKPIVIDRTLIVEPGRVLDLNLVPEEAVVKAVPTPKADEPKKEEPKTTVSKFEFEEPKKEVRLDVPYVPTPEPVVDAMLKLAKVTDKDVVYDLGCGDGRIVITAVKKFKAKNGLGIELAPERVKLSKDNAKKEGVADKVEIREGSVLDLKDVSEASVVTLYLLPDINLKLLPVLKKTLKPGSRIVSHDFDMGDWKAEKEISVKDQTGREHTIYLWTIAGEPKKEEPKAIEPKKEEPKAVIKKDELKKEEPKVVIKKDEPKKEEPKVVAKVEEKTIVVPFVPTPQKVVDEMLKLADIKKGDTVYDLGCGDGRIVITAVSKFGARNGWGLDLNPERIKDSNENAKKAGVDNRVLFQQGDVLKLKDVSEAQVVTLYLLPEVNKRLMPVLRNTLKPGARIVSHDFDMGDWKPEKKIEVTDEDGVGHTIYLWTIGK